jgi:mRNA interferase HigB
MVVISKSTLREYAQNNPRAASTIEKWYEETKAADWQHFADLKRTFNTADSVGNNRYVFDLKGNHYRLVALVLFSIRTVFVLFIGTHSEYDGINASTIEYKK